MTPLVSVIIPNYKHAPYLSKRIESVLEQSFQNFEVLILDDCSPDNSREIIEKYRDHPKVSAVIFNETNSGSTFKQWEKGVRSAKGNYIWLAESDDYADPFFLQNLVPVLESQPAVGIAYCQSAVVDENNMFLGNWSDFVRPNRIWASDFNRNGKEIIADNMLFGNIIPNASAVLFRKNIFEQAGKSHQNFRLVGDWILWVNMLFISDLYYINQPLNFFRKHSQNVRSSSQKSGKDVMEMGELSVYFFKKLSISNWSRQKMIFILVHLWSRAIQEKRFSVTQSFRLLKLMYPHDRTILLKLGKKLKPKSFPPKNRRDIKILLGEVLFPGLYKFFKRKQP